MKFVRINKKDLGRFEKTFSNAKELCVNEKISFYEPCELLAWVKRPSENLLFAVEIGGQYAGFCFAKIMSPHWAMIDTFYVAPAFRKLGVGGFMQKKIDCIIRKSGIKFISRVTKSRSMKKFLPKMGYSKRDKYVWFDKFV